MIQSLIASYQDQGTSSAPPTSSSDDEAGNIGDESEAAAVGRPRSSNRTLLIYSKQMILSFREDEYCVSRPSDLPDMTVSKSLPLHYAIEKGASEEVLQLFIKEYPAALKEIDNDGRLPLHYAIEIGAPEEVIQLLIKEYPAALKEIDNDGRLPLHYAIEKGAPEEVIQLLIKEYPAVLKERNECKSLPLHYAIEKGVSEEVIQLLIRGYPAALKEKNECKSLPLHYAIEKGAPEEVIQLLIRGYPAALKEKDFRGWQPLHAAVRYCCLEVIQLLIEEYPAALKEKDFRGWLPLHAAVRDCGLEGLQLLVQQYPDAVKEKCKDGFLPLHTAVMYCEKEEVQLLVQQYPDGLKERDWKRGLLPLHVAVWHDAPMDVLQFLVREYPDSVKERSNYGFLPLHIAVMYRDLGVVQLLAQQYPDGAKEKDLRGGWHPLHAAVWYQAPMEVIQFLLREYPEAVKEKSKDGFLPLHTAIKKELSHDVIQALVRLYPGAARERHPHSGALPLHYVIYKKLSEESILLLLDAYPQAAQEKTIDGGILFEVCLKNDASEELMLAFYKVVSKTRFDGLLPLGIVLTNGSSDDIVLAVLKENPEAARELFSTEWNVPALPLHVAIEEKRSEAVKQALRDAYPDATKEENPFETTLQLHKLLEAGTSLDSKGKDVKKITDKYPDAAKTRGINGRLPLHIAIDTNAPVQVIKRLFKAYPQAGKEKMKDGRLPVEVVAEIKGKTEYSRKVLTRLLLENDMPISIEGGTPVEHGGSWTACVSSNTKAAAAVVREFLSMAGRRDGYGKHVHALADTRDAQGRTALGIASSETRAVIYQYLLFCGRYKLQIGPPEHVTNSSVVLRAQDLDEQADYGVIFDNSDENENGQLDQQEVKAIAGSIGLTPDLFLKGLGKRAISKDTFVATCKRQLGDGPREVVIKFMQNKDHWERECNARINENYTLDPTYVVSALPNIPTQTDIAEAVVRGDGGLGMIVEKYLDGNKPGIYALVMDAADRNLQQILFQEQPKIGAVRDMLRQVFEAVRHLHGENLMHGDLKMVNIVRFRVDNKLRLIDLDASARIVPIGGEEESFAGNKFSSAILPPEMIERIETDEKLEEFSRYWVDEDEDLVKKVAPKPYKKRRCVKAHYIVKSFRKKEGIPVLEGLPYDLVRASESIDAWSLGLLAFTLLTGETLIPSNRDDDCASGAAMHFLYSWGTQPDELSELFKKIEDDAARDLVSQLLQRDPAERPTVEHLLEKHPFFHPERNDTEMQHYISEMNERLDNVNTCLNIQTEQLEIMNANILVIKQLGDESKAELFLTRSVLLKAIFEATEVSTPTSFIVLHEKLPELSNEEARQKIPDIGTAEDGSGVSMNTKYASVTLSADGADIDLEGDLKEHYEQVKTGLKWAKRIKDIGLRVAAGEVGKAFDIIKDGISDLIVGEEMYLYLIDELTGEPVQAHGWPLVITTPSELVPKLLPLMMVGMRAMCIYNGIVGLAKMFGCPLPNVPKALPKSAQESIELLKKESSVEEFDVVHEEIKGGNEEKKTVRGASLRDFVDFMEENDPGLKEEKNGDFAGLQRIGDPEDGTALWTTLTNPADIENALKKRAEQRKEEQFKHDEHVKETAKKEIEREEGNKAEISEGERMQPRRTTSVLTTGEINLSIDAQAPSIRSEEITKLIKAVATAAAKESTAAAKEAASAAKEASAAAKEAVSAAKESTAAANKAISATAGNTCCVIM